jgi:hypothetical protein
LRNDRKAFISPRFCTRQLMSVSFLKPNHTRVFTVAAAIALITAGCTSGGSGGTAQKAHNQALQNEPPEEFFTAILSEAKGVPNPKQMSPVVRKHYLTVIADSENRSQNEQTRLRNQGLLGNDYVLRALAEWRLGRLDDALVSQKKARATGQQAVTARDRALAVAMDGVVQVHKAIDLSKADGSYREVYDLIAGPTGAWAMLGQARVEASRTDGIFDSILETRLASFKVLKDAHDKLPAGSDGGVPYQKWSRMQAEAQVELAEYSRLTTKDRAAQAAKVRERQLLCNLSPPAR